jgi:hypothetical protein
MRKRSLAAGAAASAAAFATAAFAAVPATAAAPAAAPASVTPMCATSQLSAHLGGGDAAAGNLYRDLVVTNTSGTTCHLTGFPGVSLLDARGGQIGAPATREPLSYAPVVLRPGGSASDTIHTINHQGTCLPTSTSVRVYPPGNRASLVIPGELTNCHDELGISPLAAGTHGNPSDAGAPTPAPTSSATPVPTPAPTRSGGGAPVTPEPSPTRQVSVVPSGAPDTGVAAASSSGSHGTEIAAGASAAGVLLLGGLGVAARRRARARG